VGRGTRIAPGKRDLLVLDFVPANCRHQLLQAVDIFAHEGEAVVECARRIASEQSGAIALEQALEMARQEVEARQASVEYQLKQRDPFAAAGLDVEALLQRRSAGDPPSEEQAAYLRRAGLAAAQLARLSSRQAEELREQLRERKAVGLCTPKQAHQLAAHGIDARDMYYDEAKALLGDLRRRG